MNLLKVNAPVDMEIIVSCQGLARFVALTWLDGIDQLLVNDGAGDDYGDPLGFRNLGYPFFVIEKFS
jgi:hypothetical protein